MICRKCKREIPDDAIYCCYCGVEQKREPLKARRPNGMGSIKKLRGRRRRPWTALITKDKKQIYIGFYEKKAEAKAALEKLISDTRSDH